MSEDKYLNAKEDFVFDPFGTGDAEHEEPAPVEENNDMSPDTVGSQSMITNMTTDSGQPVVLVQQVQRESGTVTPANLAKRGLRTVMSFAVWIIGAIVVSLLVTAFINSASGNALTFF